MKKDHRSTATIFGEMDAWCRGIQRVYNQIHSINLVLPRPLLRAESTYGFVQLFAGDHLLYEFASWDLDALDSALDRLRFLSDFCWALHCSTVSDVLNPNMKSL